MGVKENNKSNRLVCAAKTRRELQYGAGCGIKT